MKHKHKRAPLVPHGAAGSRHPMREFEWISPVAIRTLIEEGGGGMDVVLLSLTTRESIIAMPSDLHFIVSGWLGWWQQYGEPVTCVLCEGDAAPYEGLPPAVAVLRLTPREVTGADGTMVVESPVLVHGVCPACANKPNATVSVCDEIRRTLFPDAVQIDAEHALHMMPYGGRA